MGNMRFKVGDRVRIKSLDWYNENKSKRGFICFDYANFIPEMSRYCGEILTINRVVEEFEHYLVSECAFSWTDEMIEGLVEVETKPNIIEEAKTYWDSIKDAWICPDGYIFKDENGNEILTSKIILEKKKEIIPNLQLDSIRTVREYNTVHSRIWLEIYEDNPKVCIFTHLWVDDAHRQKGYGTKALEQAEIIAKDLGCETIHIKVETDSWMHDWYLRFGYKFLTNTEDNYTWLTKSM